MAARHSLTFQINSSLPGHAAVVVNEPSRQTYAGFGPQHHRSISDNGRFDVNPVQQGKESPNDYSSAFGDGQYGTFTVPISEAQAKGALKEIDKIQSEPHWYTGWDIARFSQDPRICTTIVNRITQAAGLGKHLYPIPQANFEYLSDIADTLANDPKAKLTSRSGLPIPDALRGIQKDYAYVGGGYDTPSERLGRFASGPLLTPPEATPSFNERFNGQPESPNGATPTSHDQSFSADQGAGQAERYLRGRLVDRTGRTVFEIGAPSVPFVRSGPLASQAAVSNQPLRSSSSRTAPAGAQYAGNNVRLPGGNSSGQALPSYPVPPVLGGADASAPTDADMSDWFTRWVKPPMQN